MATALQRAEDGVYNHESMRALYGPVDDPNLFGLPDNLRSSDIPIETALILSNLRTDLETDFQMGALPQGIRDTVWEHATKGHDVTKANPIIPERAKLICTNYAALAAVAKRLHRRLYREP